MGSALLEKAQKKHEHRKTRNGFGNRSIIDLLLRVMVANAASFIPR